jgi:hypothetical protein
MKKNLGKTTPQGRAKKRVRKVATTTKKTITKKVKADIDKLVKKASATIDKSVAKAKKITSKKCIVAKKKNKTATKRNIKSKTSLAGAKKTNKREVIIMQNNKLIAKKVCNTASEEIKFIKEKCGNLVMKDFKKNGWAIFRKYNR